VSDSVWHHRRQPTRLPRPWDSPGKNTGVGCHFLLQCVKVKSESEVAQSCPTLRDPMDCSPPGSSVHVIFQARVLEWGAIAFNSGDPWIIQPKMKMYKLQLTSKCLAALIFSYLLLFSLHANWASPPMFLSFCLLIFSNRRKPRDAWDCPQHWAFQPVDPGWLWPSPSQHAVLWLPCIDQQNPLFSCCILTGNLLPSHDTSGWV